MYLQVLDLFVGFGDCLVLASHMHKSPVQTEAKLAGQGTFFIKGSPQLFHLECSDLSYAQCLIFTHVLLLNVYLCLFLADNDQINKTIPAMKKGILSICPVFNAHIDSYAACFTFTDSIKNRAVKVKIKNKPNNEPLGVLSFDFL